MSQRPFRFAVQSYNAESPASWRERARQAEDLGYSALHLADHYLGDGPALAATSHPHQQYAALPMMVAAAEATSTIKIGARVFCIDYKPLAVLVKEVATLDWLSGGGRVEFGVGAGWLAGEYEALGIPMDTAGVRVSRLEQYVRAAKQMMSGEPLDIETDHVSLRGFTASPVPESPIPIMIGGGAPRVLGIAGREADIVSLNFDNSSGKIGPAGVQSSTAEKIDEKVRWVREGAESVGRDVPEIEIAGYFTVVTPDEAAGEATAGQFAKMFGLEAQDIVDHPNCLIGTLDQITGRIQERRERYGISYVTVGDTNMEAFAPVVERLVGT